MSPMSVAVQVAPSRRPSSCSVLPASTPGRTWTLPARPGRAVRPRARPVDRWACCWTSCWPARPASLRRPRPGSVAPPEGIENMTEVAFHFNAPDKLAYACRLLRKAVGSGARVVVTAPADVLARLNSLLWTFSQLDFIPHATVNDPAHVLAAS